MGGFIEKCAIWHNLYCPDNFTSTFSHYKANTLSHYKANTSYDDTCLINIAMEYVNLVCIHVHVSCLLMPASALSTVYIATMLHKLYEKRHKYIQSTNEITGLANIYMYLPVYMYICVNW